MRTGVNAGATTITVGAYHGHSHTPTEEVSFPTTRDPRVDLLAIVAAVRQLADRHGPAERLGLAVAGKLDRARTQLIGAGELKPWVGFTLHDYLRGELDCPVVLGSDAEGEGAMQALINPEAGDDFVYGCLGTGIGGCRVRRLGSQLITLPAEPGHINIRPGQQLIRHVCGQWDCLEAYCGGESLARRYRVPHAGQLTMAQWREVQADLAIGFTALMQGHPVEKLILGGGMVDKDRHLVDDLQRGLDASLRVIAPPKVVASTFPAASTAGRALLDLSF